MAILAFAGAEDGTAEVITGGTVAQSSTYARTGTYSFRLNGYTAEYTNTVSLVVSPKSTLFFQGAIRGSANPINDGFGLVAWKKGATIIGVVTVKNDMTGMTVWRGNKETVLGSIGITIPLTTFLLLEFQVTVHDTTGVIKVWANGQLVFDYAGDTKPGADTTIDNVTYAQVSATINNYTYWDDLIVADDQGLYFNTGTNGARIHRVAITGPGNYAQWTPQGDAANWNCIKETPPSIDKYVESTTTGQKDSYEPANAPVVGGIAAVVVRYWAQGGITLKRLCRSGGTDYLGSQLTMTGAFGKTDDIMYEHPAGGAWTESSFNAIEVGQEKV